MLNNILSNLLLEDAYMDIGLQSKGDAILPETSTSDTEWYEDIW